MLAANWRIVTSAPALAVPEVALIVAEPLATAVTNPVEDTVATDVNDELHVTEAPVMALPF